MLEIIGFDKEFEFILNGKKVNSWIIYGDKGIGKSHFCFNLARQLLGMNPSDCVDFKYISKGEDKYISVDKIRELKDFAILRPGQAPYKVVIIDSGDDLNQNSSNSLLKILEEPPEFLVIFLISHNISKLLPTIKSRCIKINLPKHNVYDFYKIIAQHGISGEEAKQLYLLTEGVPGLAIEYHNNKTIVMYQKFLKLTKGEFKIKLINELAIQPQTLLVFCLRICNIVSNKAIEQFQELSLVEQEFLEKISGNIYTVMKIWDEIKNILIKSMNASLDDKQVMLTCYNYLRNL